MLSLYILIALLVLGLIVADTDRDPDPVTISMALLWPATLGIVLLAFIGFCAVSLFGRWWDLGNY